ncbi:MAG: hypothetical protein ABJB47_02540 [Actinomycetota bacterium]
MTIVAIVVVVVVVAALVAGVAAVTRRRRLQQRFGPEYDRLVSEHDSKHKAAAELKEREKRVSKLDIRPLTEDARASYSGQWAAIQERFVDAPTEAVTESQVLVVAVMKDRGYPTEHRDQIADDLSVEHSNMLENYRAAEQISENATAGTASTEDLRQAMIHYRSMFRDLLGESATADAAAPASPADGSEWTGTPDSVPQRTNDDRTATTDGEGADRISEPLTEDDLARDDRAREDMAADSRPDGPAERPAKRS